VENSKFARDIYGAHVMSMHVKVMERCADNLVNR